MTELEALVTLNQLPKIGPIRARRLIDYFGSAPAVLRAPKSALRQVNGCGPQLVDILTNWQEHSNAKEELQEAEQRGISILDSSHPDWPIAFLEMHDPPLILYVWGTLKPEDQSSIAIIGSRKTTHYGNEITKTFSYQLASAGWTILSGLARGIDTFAHEAALAANGRTIAVLGSGLAQLYPPENLAIAEKISQNGAVISEFPLHTPPDKQTFPQRNRIVAAWAQATLVTEMPKRSGAMITAKFAQEYGRQVFAVPGPIDRLSSEGCHLLIREGATLATSAQDILDDLVLTTRELPFEAVKKEPVNDQSSLSPNEQAVLATLHSHEQSIDEILAQTNLSVSEVSTTLLSLELQRRVKQHPGMTYTTATGSL